MALGTFIAGAYTMTWNSVALGIQRGEQESPSLEFQAFMEEIRNTDAYGRMLLDGIYLGGDYTFSCFCKEYKAGPIAAMWPFGTFGVAGVIGRLMTDLAQSLVLTSVTGTPAVATPASLTATKTLLAPNFPVKLLYGPTLREVPLRLNLYPIDSSGIKWLTQT